MCSFLQPDNHHDDPYVDIHIYLHICMYVLYVYVYSDMQTVNMPKYIGLQKYLLTDLATGFKPQNNTHCCI